MQRSVQTDQALFQSLLTDGVTLPADSKITDGTKLALEGADDVPVRQVNFFTASGGLSTPAKVFRFKATTANTYTFTSYTLANGNSITQGQGTTLFTF